MNGRNASLILFLIGLFAILQANCFAAYEGFESRLPGELQRISVQNAIGDSPWIEEENFFQSGLINHNQKSVFSKTLEFLQNGNISFGITLSSEKYYDFLIFYIDSVEKGRWSGEVQKDISFPVTSGFHSFLWAYEKDYSVDGGYDTAWIYDFSASPCNEFIPWFQYQNAAKSEHIAHNQKSVFPLTLEFAQRGDISFNLKVLSERNYDFLVFYIDGIEKGRWSGEVRKDVSFPVTEGFHTLMWVYDKDYSVNTGMDAAWISDISCPFKPLNNGNAPWRLSTSYAVTGASSAQAGIIYHNQKSLLPIYMNIAFNGYISFSFRVSSEDYYDFLVFYIDGVEQERWAGEINDRVSFPVSAGRHIFTWAYEKDYSINKGEDTAWIDNIFFPPLVSESRPWWLEFDNYIDNSLFTNPEITPFPIMGLESHQACQDDIISGWTLQKHGEALLAGIKFMQYDTELAKNHFADATRELAQFAASLKCLDFNGLIFWDSVIGNFLEDAIWNQQQGNLSASETIMALWNPALLIIDALQITGESNIVNLIQNTSEFFRNALQNYPVDTYGAALLEDIGQGTLLKTIGHESLDNLILSLAQPAHLGIGLCPMLDHALKKDPDASCLAGLNEYDEICTGAGILESLRNLGLVTYVAHATYFNEYKMIVPPSEPYSGWFTTISEEYPKTYFGTSLDELPSLLDLTGKLCTGNNSEGGGMSPAFSSLPECIFDLLQLGFKEPGIKIMQCLQNNSRQNRLGFETVEIRIPADICGTINPSEEEGEGVVNKEAIQKAVSKFFNNENKNGNESGDESNNSESSLSDEVWENLEKVKEELFPGNSNIINDLANKNSIDSSQIDSAYEISSNTLSVNFEKPDFIQELAEKIPILQKALELEGIPLTDDLAISSDFKMFILKGRFGGFMPNPEGQDGCKKTAVEQRAQIIFDCIFLDEEEVSVFASLDPVVLPVSPEADVDLPVTCMEMGPNMYWWDKKPSNNEDMYVDTSPPIIDETRDPNYGIIDPVPPIIDETRDSNYGVIDPFRTGLRVIQPNNYTPSVFQNYYQLHIPGNLSSSSNSVENRIYQPLYEFRR